MRKITIYIDENLGNALDAEVKRTNDSIFSFESISIPKLVSGAVLKQFKEFLFLKSVDDELLQNFEVWELAPEESTRPGRPTTYNETKDFYNEFLEYRKNHTVKETCKNFNISESTLYRIQRKLKAYGKAKQ